MPPDDDQSQHGLKMPKHQKTKPSTWLIGVLCAIFSLVLLLAGLLVLVMYLWFKPKIPRFDVASITLNTAYIDANSQLNADITLLTNFSNPNRKVSVEFKYMIFQLYYDNNPIATKTIDKFSVSRAETRFKAVEMIASQVALPWEVTQKLTKQMAQNSIVFDLKGLFRSRSNFGSLFHYSYKLYTECFFNMTRPPMGIMKAHKCGTKL